MNITHLIAARTGSPTPPTGSVLVQHLPQPASIPPAPGRRSDGWHAEFHGSSSGTVFSYDLGHFADLAIAESTTRQHAVSLGLTLGDFDDRVLDIVDIACTVRQAKVRTQDTTPAATMRYTIWPPQ